MITNGDSRLYYKGYDVNKVVAHTYLFCITLRMIYPLNEKLSSLHGLSWGTDFIISTFGMLILLLQNRAKVTLDKTEAKLYRHIIIVVAIFDFLSIIMAIYTQLKYGEYAGESAFEGVAGMCVYYIHFALIVAFNIIIFNLLSENEIRKNLGCLCDFLLILGYAQIVAFKVTFIDAFIRRIDICKILMPDEAMWKLSLTGREGSSAGSIFAILILPYLLSNILTKKLRKKYVMRLFLWLPVLYYMKSSLAYLLMIVCIGTFVYIGLMESEYKHHIKNQIIIFCFVCAASLLAAEICGIRLSRETGSILYLIVDKFRDMKNLSTAIRWTPTLISIKLFLKNPFFGVGNGLQGYFYLENMPEWALEIFEMMPNHTGNVRTTLHNAGGFWNGIISGYGLVGIVLMVRFIVLSYHTIKQKKHEAEFWYYFYVLGGTSILVSGLQSDFVGNYMVWLVLSIPFIKSRKIKGFDVSHGKETVRY